MTRSKVRPAVRAAAIADLLAGEQPAVVAARYGLDAAQMRVWKQRYVTEHVTPVAPVVIRPSVERAQVDIADLIMKNLEAKLIATQRIAEHATDPTWLQKQTAAELGELFTHIDRSAVDILDRMAGRRRPEGDHGGGESDRLDTASGPADNGLGERG